MLFTIIKGMVNYGYFRILFRVQKNGYENIPEDGGFVLCANHTSNVDVPALVLTMKRKLNFMAKESLFKVPVIGWVVAMSGAFPVKRGGNDLGAIKTALTILKSGEPVAVFPEATRIRKGKTADAIKAGAIMMAKTAKVPIIPVGINATYKPFSIVKINVGKPIYLDEYYDQKLTSLQTEELIGSVFDKVKKLAGEEA